MGKIGLGITGLSAIAGLIAYYAAHSWPAVIGSAVFFGLGVLVIVKGGD